MRVRVRVRVSVDDLISRLNHSRTGDHRGTILPGLRRGRWSVLFLQFGRPFALEFPLVGGCLFTSPGGHLTGQEGRGQEGRGQEGVLSGWIEKVR